VYSIFAQSIDKIEIPGSITIVGNHLSNSNESVRYAVGEDLNTINALGFTVYSLADQNDPIPLVRVSTLSDEEHRMLENFKAIILIEGLAGSINNRFISKNIRLIGYFPAADNLLLNKNGFMYAIYSGITLYEMNYGQVIPMPVWEGGVNRKSAYIVDNKIYDFHGIRSRHLYDLSTPESPRLIETANDFQIQYHHTRWFHEEAFFEGCENLATHPDLTHNYHDFTPADNKEYFSLRQTDVFNKLDLENNLGYIYHYIVGFRLYSNDNMDKLILDIDPMVKNEYKSFNTGALGIYPSTETGQFYINDYSGLYIFEKLSSNNSNISLTKDNKPIILSSKNYPNPFNPQTTIEFELIENAHVNLKIYNVLGEEIETIANEYLIKGKYQRIWDASDVASGIYFYHLDINTIPTIISESTSLIDRIILLK
jgi:hypothetical protein